MKWMTVEQVAEHLQLSKVQVYKMAQNAEMPATKIGRVWRFEKGAIDRWLQSESQMPKLRNADPIVQEILNAFVRELHQQYPDNLAQVVLYGSRARGDANVESDIDVLVVFKKIPDYWNLFREVGNLAYKVTFGSQRTLVMGPIIMDEEKFIQGNEPILWNIRKEGKRAA